MNKLLLNCFAIAVLTLYLQPYTVVGQTESGGLFSKLMMMMMKNRRRTYVPFAIPFNPLSYSSIIPINYPATLPIGGLPNYRSSLIGSLNGGAPLGPFGGISPFSLGTFAPFLSSLRSDHKFLSRSSYEPTVASSSLMPQYTVVAPPAAVSASPATTNSFLIAASPAATITNPLTALNNLLPTSTFASTPTSQSAAAVSLNPLNPLLTPAPSNAISNSNSLTNSLTSLTNPTLSNSHLYSSTNTASLLTPTTTTSLNNNNNNNYLSNNTTSLFSNTGYSNAASNGNNLISDKTMTGSQGELIKQELKEHHLNNIRIQYLKNLRDHLIKDNLQKEQYLKELTKKSTVFPYLDMYEEVGNNNRES